MIKYRAVLAAFATAAVLGAAPVGAQQSVAAPDKARPADPTANLPSDRGAQTTLPSGAVTGAGHPQGTTPEPNAAAPGGVVERARDQARSEGKGEPDSRADPGASAGSSDDASRGGSSGRR